MVEGESQPLQAALWPLTYKHQHGVKKKVIILKATKRVLSGHVDYNVRGEREVKEDGRDSRSMWEWWGS